MEKDIISQLHSLRNIKPDEHFRATQKEILMNQISASAQTAKGAGFVWFYLKETFKYEMSLLGQPVAGLAVILLLIFGGGVFSISAASEATPGSFLYTVKIVSEKTRFAFALQPEDKMKLNFEFAERRAAEIKTLAGNNEHEKISQAADNLKEEIASAQKQLKQMEANSPKTAMAMAKDIENKTTALRATLRETKETLAHSSGSAKNKLNETIQTVDAVSLSALNTIVKSADNASGAEKAELNRRVASKLKASKEKINEARAEAKVFSAGFARSETGLQVFLGQAVENKTKEATKVITEAEKLLSGNDYQGALDKIAESDNLLNEATAATAEKEALSTSTPEVKAETKPEVKGVMEEATTTGVVR
ncbi:hypothetical protein COU00_04450 [Candidatus Falkowbacteria bacterium CG10_big_fil_rev_8_21_14_0_10_43_11]|uniref:DUF5667 domain-containing protein n=1 Tax=Candidatus Falkowbacteria bacterium CG10_big_fil_rev_8_21_14_0_10_43_11 TaxID=1974568 RepID=A0A2M6WKW1_9BACT|nr:MAG: hypothetical protein COU00_04450 [Candidatus Falkowbacteria bacterium CG10_big_fil_rev_8_21_14_0_10_43_11]